MITDFFIDLVVGLVTGLLGLLPTTPSPPDVAGLISSALAVPLNSIQGYGWFPVQQLGLGIAAMGAWFAALYLVRVGGWILAMLHVSGTDPA